jgi:hypothetical protein
MPYRFGVMGDRLVGIGGPMVMGEDWDYVDPDDGRRWDFADRAWYSDDGLSWTMSRLPGGRPRVSDLAVRPDGSMAIAVGYTTDERNDWAGAVWVTTDGVEWQAVMPPSKREVDWVAASDEVVAVSAGYQLWTTTDLEEWTRVKGSSPVGITYGPGGFLAAEGGGQDLISPTALWHSEDGVEWAKVKLPKALRKASVGVSAYPLDEEWLLVPDKRGLMYRSPDGKRWRKVSRPPDMTVGYVSWLVDLGDVVQAHGVLFDRERQPDGVWTFRPGERMPKAKVPPEGFVESPVVWDDQFIGYGFIRDEDEDETMTMWRRQEADTDEEAVGGGELETANAPGQRLEVTNVGVAITYPSDWHARALDWVKGSAGGGAERFIEEASLFTTGDGPDETCSLLRVKPRGVDFAASSRRTQPGWGRPMAGRARSRPNGSSCNLATAPASSWRTHQGQRRATSSWP